MERGVTTDGAGSLEARLLEAVPAVRGYCRRLVSAGGPGLDAEDLVQDVMERALRYRHAFDGEREVLPWLKRTALRVFLDARAARGRDPRTLDGTVPERGTARDATTAGTDDRDEVERWLARLPSIEREALERFHREGQSIAEIAAALGLPEGTVKSHLHRARRRLGEMQEGRHDDD